MAIERIGLQICVPPLYWYSDYIALIQFIEVSFISILLISLGQYKLQKTEQHC